MCTRSDNVPIRNSFIQNVYSLGSKWDTQNSINNIYQHPRTLQYTCTYTLQKETSTKSKVSFGSGCVYRNVLGTIVSCTHWFLGFLMTSGSREHCSTCTLAFISGVTYPWMYWPWNCKSKANVNYFLPSTYRVQWSPKLFLVCQTKCPANILPDILILCWTFCYLISRK